MTLSGVDISEHNSADPTLTNLAFVIARCSIGATKDLRWDQHSSYVLSHPPVRLFAYHYADHHVDPVIQANTALRIVGNKVHTLFLDREGDTDVTDSQASQIFAIWRKAGKIPGEYHSLSGYPRNLGQSVNWIAAWGIPPTGAWNFWQTSGAPLDRDIFNGDNSLLDQLAGIKAALPTYQVAIPGHSTPVYLSTTGIVIGHVTRATYKCNKYFISGHWWYRIISAGTYRNYWLPAEPWMIVTRV